LRKPDHFLSAAGDTPMQTIGNTLLRVDPVLEGERPDALLVLGDTNSCLAVIAAKRRKVPVFHMEAGNRCFDERVPEEINRRLVDHLSDINLPYSERARELLLREGLPPDRIIKTGSPMYEVLHNQLDKARASDVLARLKLSRGEYFLVSAHREENEDEAPRLRALAETLNSLAERHRRRVIVSAHPRTRKQVDALGATFDARVGCTNLWLLGLPLQMNALAVLSDSGTITEESSILGFPALNIRDTHERHEGMEEGAVMMTGLGAERVLQALAVLLERPREAASAIRMPADYNVPNVSEKVVRIILSYVDYVNRVVWRR
jgi:UDP-N-acetylglucosamine 2-epimerase (non-hydrolysing)